MSHWFHRNNLKATTVISYNQAFNGPFNLTKLACDLKKTRDRLLDMLPDASHNIDSINNAFILYLSFMSGFFMDYKLSQKKVRYMITYKWTHTLLGQIPQAQEDAAYDVANMSINVALWYMKHASYVASKKLITMEDAKEIHTSLRKAAGIFQMVEKDIVPLLEVQTAGSDLDQRVLKAYLNQCVAEAQEVTVARAINMQHSSSLISALAHETSKMFETAEFSLRGLPKNISEQWVLYLMIKKCIYLTYAYCYCGKNLLSEDHCGEAIKALRESQIFYSRALSMCKAYSKVKGPSKPVKPDGHTFFTGINTTVTQLLDKCERENGFIYHQKVPPFPPDLELKGTYGLARPEVYNMSPPAPLWEAAFENQNLLPSIPKESLKVAKHKKEKELPPVEKENHERSDEIVENGCGVQ